MPRNLSLKIFASETSKVTTISDGGLFLDVSSIQMFDANGAAVTDSSVVVTVGVSADGVAYQSKVVSSDSSLGGFDFKYIKLSASSHTIAASVVVNLKVCGIDEAMSDRQYKGRLAELFTVKAHDPSTLPGTNALGFGKSVGIPRTGGLVQSNGSSLLGILYRNNTPVSSANSVASNFQTPVASFTVPAGAMDKDSTLIIDMIMRVFDTVSASRIVRVFANTQQIAAHSFTSTSGLIPMQFRMSNCGDAGAQLQSAGLTINGTEQATVNTRQIDTDWHPVEITITVETPSGQMIKQALFVELK